MVLGATLAAAVLVVAASFAWKSLNEQPASVTLTSGRLGTKNLPSPVKVLPPVEAGIDRNLERAVPDGIEVTTDGRLVISVGLHNVYDYFLLTGQFGTREQQTVALDGYLKRRLPSSALSEALDLVRRYVRYMVEHDRLLEQQSPQATVQNGGQRGLDVDRMAAWVANRSRLRQSILGKHVAEVWFAEDEAQSQQLIVNLRQRAAGMSVSQREESDKLQRAGNALVALQVKRGGTVEQRAALVKEFGESAGLRYDRIQEQEQALMTRVAQYRQQVQAIDASLSLDASQKVLRYEELRNQMFADDAERLRARTLVGR